MRPCPRRRADLPSTGRHTMATRSHPTHRVALAALLALQGAAWAQTSTTITVVGRADGGASVGGFGGALATQPLQATVLGADVLRDAGIVSVAGVAGLDARVSDAYNTTGYWSGLTVRGFEVNQRTNFRRDGLPINAETWLPLADKDRVEGAGRHQRHPGRHQCPRRPGQPGRQAAHRQCARPEPGLDRTRHDRCCAGPFPTFRKRRPVRRPPERAGLAPAAPAARCRRPCQPVRPGAGLATHERFEAGIRDRVQPHSQPSVPAFSLLGGQLPDAKAMDPAHQHQQPALEPAGGAERRHRVTALDVQAGRRCAAVGARRHAATQERRPRGLSLRLQRRRQLQPLLQRRQLRPVRLPQRERTPPHRRAGRATAGTCRHRACAAPPDRRRAAEPCARSLPKTSLQLRGQRQHRGRHRDRARPVADRREHQPRRAQPRVVSARCVADQRSVAAVGRSATHAAAPRKRAHQRVACHRRHAVVHHALAGAGLRTCGRHLGLRQLGPRHRIRRHPQPQQVRQCR